MSARLLKALFVLSLLLINGQNLLKAEESKTDKLINEYIERYEALAMEEKERTGVPASIKLAQGLLESRYGTSNLAVSANNHFGIKCKKEWTGEKVLADDDAPNECFRKYPSARDSYKDHSVFLKKHRLNFYDHLFEIDTRDYKAWAVGLQHAGYSTTNYYGRSLIYIIEKFKLYELDGSDLGWTTPTATGECLSDKAREVLDIKLAAGKSSKTARANTSSGASRIGNTTRSSNKSAIKLPGVKVHMVRERDNMEKIAQFYALDLELLYQLNKMSFGSQPAVGERIYLNSEAKNPPQLKTIKYDKK